ncbi:MAG: undecaprenyl-diphosphate phosphatase [Gammaproteobacteria bacterium]|nr:undecaprenyl-diphosphate phosphatase [Gammaproteobacteria bacterium]
MDWLQIIVLALIQGITEFLPISSSAHLILPAQLDFWPDQGLAYDVAVHLGTLLAVAGYYRAELARFAGSSWLYASKRTYDSHLDLLLKICLATLPVVVCGFVLRDWVATEFRSVLVIAVTTILFGLLLWRADRSRPRFTDISWAHALIIGAAQALAIVPGTSRSGVTITAALLLGLTRTQAAKFSFLLSIPAIAGAALLTTLDLMDSPETVRWLDLAAGSLLAFISAYACIHLFVRLVERIGMFPFVVYRLLLGGVLLAMVAGGLDSI